MRYVTETRLNVLEKLMQSIPDAEERSYALHLLESIRQDIDVNYAEVQRPIRLADLGRRTGPVAADAASPPEEQPQRQRLPPLRSTDERDS